MKATYLKAIRGLNKEPSQPSFYLVIYGGARTMITYLYTFLAKEHIEYQRKLCELFDLLLQLVLVLAIQGLMK